MGVDHDLKSWRISRIREEERKRSKVPSGWWEGLAQGPHMGAAGSRG